MTRFLFLLIGLFLVCAQQSAAQQTPPAPAIVIADNVSVSANRILIARGNVEVIQGDIRLTASAVTFDGTQGRLEFEGPLVLNDGTNATLLADGAELDRDLQTGILHGARMILDEHVQLASTRMQRVGTRYNHLYQTVATSCRICETGRPPLWHIRAKHVIHDREEKQLYFDNAQLRIYNVPVFYVPRLRLPDPSLERATGFLFPSIRQTTQLGTGVKIPYFIRLGDHRDLTLTPYLSPETRTLELRYRQAFVKGDIELNGAISDDTLTPGKQRGYLIAEGAFDLARNYKLEFDAELTSDDAYLIEYGYPSKDRLDSEIAISRTRRDEYQRIGVIAYHTLRDGEDNETLPTRVFDASYERRFHPTLGGELRLDLAAHAHERRSNSTVSGVGRDVSRVHGDIAWLGAWALPFGMRADGHIGIGFDVFKTFQDSTFQGRSTQTVPHAAIALRYPLMRRTQTGVTQVLEPVVQLSWIGGSQANVANDESTRVEFDAGNLLALSRFPERDRREHGPVLALGASWSRFGANGWASSLSMGQILRRDSNGDFTDTSGLQGRASDFLVAGQLSGPNGLSLAGRALVNQRLDFAKAEIRTDWSADLWELSGSYVWLVADAEENRAKAVSEFTFDGDYRLSRHWNLSGNWRYDAQDDRTATAGLGIGYTNECIAAKLTVERRFTSSTSVEPSTDFGFTVNLMGFSAQSDTGTYTKSCS